MFILRRVLRTTGIYVGRPGALAPAAFVSSNYHRPISQIPSHTYTCDIDAEPIHRYRPGGYHPISLGDRLKNGRYKILHKVGWGGYSTTWAARDQVGQRYVAVKISVSEAGRSHETEILRLISSFPSDTRIGQEHIVQLLDRFHIDGPNGRHQCLVLELLGPSVPDIVDFYCRDERLPAQTAKSIAHQALVGVDFLTQLKIGHGDLHTRNIALVMPNVDSLNEQQFVDTLGQPEIGLLQRTDGHASEIHVPPYIVRPTAFKAKEVLRNLQAPVVKLIDFGESFLPNRAPATLHTPLVVRAPEVLFGDRIDHRVDLWSMGCLLFELFTGQPPFDSIMITPDGLISQMIEFSTDKLPGRWERKWQDMKKRSSHDDKDLPCKLQEWLEEVYFDPDRCCKFTKQDIAKIGEFVGRLLKFEPSFRSTAKDIANDPWFQ